MCDMFLKTFMCDEMF
uniref:Uncharacterized protein n=2 Tax=Oryza TaxID=4527 RepID=A0A0E0CLH3_9ORYZ